MPDSLCSLLSRTLVAFTIEADDEFEHRIPHRTTNHGTTNHGSTASSEESAETPWLVSLLMWSTCMRFVPADGVSVRSYARSAWWLTPKGISTTLRRMGGWWNYLSLDELSEPDGSAKADRTVRPTAGGRRAQQAWQPLTEQIEERWRDRFGPQQIAALRSTLENLIVQFDRPLPDCLPLYDVDLDRRTPSRPEVATSLPGLLSQAILRFELDFQSEHPVPLAVCGNVLRVLSGDGLPVKDLPARTGLTKDGVEAGLRALHHRKLATVAPDRGGRRLRVATLTRTGAAQQRQAAELINTTEAQWQRRYGQQHLAALRDALAPIAGEANDPAGPLWEGLYRYPDGWRSALPRPDTLPHYPAVSHRGGYLDGA